MTKDLDVKNIAIIGAGYSGLSTLADLLYTNKDGHSTIATGKKPSDPAFTTLKVFEQNGHIGGAWNYTETTDPDFLGHEHLKKQYWEPKEIIDDKHRWKNSAVYENLYTNISADFMTLTTLGKRVYPKREFSPFITHREVLKILVDFVEKHGLEPYIQFHSAVENVIKDSKGKYQLTIRLIDPITKEERLSTETFDAIVVASGRFQYPHIPQIPHLAEFNAAHPGVIQHTKSFRTGEKYRGKKVLIVGTSVSSIGVLEYLKPVANEVHLSIRTPQPTNSIQNYYSRAFGQEGIHRHGVITDFDPEKNQLTFADGEAVNDFDHIIFATGFHIYYPFLQNIPGAASIEKSQGDQRGLILNLYRFVFTIGEPTIAHVGLPSSGFFVHYAEAQGAAIAGVWSNARRLPDIKEQKKWVTDRLEEMKGKRIAHQYEPGEAKSAIIDIEENYVPFERPKISDWSDIELFENQKQQLEVIFYKFANGEVPESYVLKNDTSGL